MSEHISQARRVAKEIICVLQDNPDAFRNDERLQKTLTEILTLDNDFEEKGGVFFHTGSDAFETAKRFTQIHVEQYRETGRPSLPALAVHHAGQIGLDKDSPEYKAMILVAVRAEMKAAVTPEYHSKFHYMDVAAMTANLLEKNNEMAGLGDESAVRLTKQEQALAFIAAIGHDLDHDGHGNPKDNPTLNEQKSFELMLPLLEEAGLSGADISKMHTILMTTSPNGPHAVLKAVAKAQREGQPVDFAMNFFPELQALVDDPRLTQMAAIVSDADLYASSGAGIKSSALMSRLLTAEGKGAMDFTADSARKFFLDTIVGKDGFKSHAGREVANKSLELLRQETDHRLAGGKFDGRLKGSSYHIDYYQTPDGQKGADGKLLRPKARYSKEKGYDSAQQDSAFILPGAPDLRSKPLVDVFDEMERGMRDNPNFAESGATGSVAHISKDGMLTIAYVGDSPVKVYVRDPKTGKVINGNEITPPHDCDNISDAEKARVEEAGGFIIPVQGTMRLNGRIMLTRSLGDFDSVGMSAKPDVIQRDLKQYFDKGYEVIVIVESDGAMDGPGTTENQRMNIMDAYAANGQATNLSEKLAMLSDKNKADDNITSVATVLTGAPKENIIMAIFDGHGKHGAEAAHVATEYIVAHFDSNLRAVRTINPDMDETPGMAVPLSSPKQNQAQQKSKPPTA